jgi:hypothetical protein
MADSEEFYEFQGRYDKGPRGAADGFTGILVIHPGNEASASPSAFIRMKVSIGTRKGTYAEMVESLRMTPEGAINFTVGGAMSFTGHRSGGEINGRHTFRQGKRRLTGPWSAKPASHETLREVLVEIRERMRARREK